jgi:hypothetical protein
MEELVKASRIQLPKVESKVVTDAEGRTRRGPKEPVVEPKEETVEPKEETKPSAQSILNDLVDEFSMIEVLTNNDGREIIKAWADLNNVSIDEAMVSEIQKLVDNQLKDESN